MQEKLKKRSILIYAIIIFLQLLVIVYWSSCKTNYHIDELFSMAYANDFFGLRGNPQYITESDEFVWDAWINASEFKRYMSIPWEGKVFNAPLSKVIKVLFTERNYFGLLNIAESVVGTSKAGIMLNCLFFVITEIVLISLMRKLDMDSITGYLALAMFGFSVYIISAAEFIRFYMLVIMLLLIILNLCYRIWNSEKWGVIILNEITVLILVYFSFNNSELVIPFFAAFWACFLVASLILKKRKQSITGVVVCALGVIYLATQTIVLDVLLNANAYDNSGVWGQSSAAIIDSITSISTYTIMDFLMWIKSLFEYYYFATRPIMYLVLAAVSICLIITVVPDKKYSIDVKRINPVAGAMFLFWMGLFGASFVLDHGREISALVIYCILIMIFAQATGFRFRLSEVRVSSDSIFVALLAVAAILSIIFGELCSFRIWRYYCYGFVSMTVVFWYFVDRIIKSQTLVSARRPLLVILIVFVTINAIIPFRTRSIEYIFEDEKGFVESIHNLEGMDVVLFLPPDKGPTLHALYDCVNIIPDSTMMYIADLNQYEYNSMDYPDTFILWAYSESDLDTVTGDLEKNGYQVDEIGTDYCSRAFCVNFVN